MRDKNFGYWLRKQMNEIERSHEWLYRKVGTSSGAVNRWCNGCSPSLYIVIKILKVLSVQKGCTQGKLYEDYLEYQK